MANDKLPEQMNEIDKRLTTHEAVCAFRYAQFLGRLSRLEAILLATAGVLIMSMVAVLWETVVIARP